jgi:hypothetical protein
MASLERTAYPTLPKAYSKAELQRDFFRSQMMRLNGYEASPRPLFTSISPFSSRPFRCSGIFLISPTYLINWWISFAESWVSVAR